MNNTTLDECFEIIGNLEVFNESFIQGWVINPDSEFLELTLRIDETDYPLNISLESRGDIAEKFGDNYADSGFSCHLGDKLSRLLQLASQNDKAIEVLVRGLRLSGVSFERFNKGSKSLGNSESQSPQVNSAQVGDARIERIECFSVKGWAVNVNGFSVNPRLFKVYCNEHQVELPIITLNRPDVSRELGIVGIDTGFEIILPGYMWMYAEKDFSLKIKVVISDYEPKSAVIEISREQVTKWVTEIADAQKDTYKDDWYTFIALEHIHYGQLQERLDSRATNFFTDFAKRHQLYVPLNNENSNLELNKNVVIENPSNLFLWEAMKDLNTLLVRGDKNHSVYTPIISCLNKHRLTGEAREWYLYLAIQLTCESGEYKRLINDLDIYKFEEFADLTAEYPPTQMSLSLPMLVCRKEIGWAIKLLHKLTKRIYDGWIHMCCIRFATEEVQRLYVLSKVDIKELEEYNFAFFEFLRNFKGQWFSRLHDHDIMSAAVCILSEIDLYRDDHRKYVVSSSISIYGLSPAFWRQLSNAGIVELDAELSLAKQHFQTIRDQFIQNKFREDTSLPALEKAVRFFSSRGNLELVIVLREICMNLLPKINCAPSESNLRIAEMLLDLDPNSAIRINAFPLGTTNQLQLIFEQTNIECFHSILARASGTARSPSSRICFKVSALFKELEHLSKSSSNEIPFRMKDVIREIEKSSVSLSNPEEKYIAFDILASLFSNSVVNGHEDTSILMRIRAIFQDLFNSCNDRDMAFAAPVLSGLGKLRSLNKTETSSIFLSMLNEFETSVKSQIRGKALFDEPFSNKLDISTKQKGWQSDTLVAIFLSKDELDKKITNIRRDWVQQLSEYKISHIFVVSGDENCLQDDNILVLNISDEYDDRAKQCIYFLDWVYHNTNFQYIVKVNDGCYLNVDRYFGSLSYRKHHYYGSVTKIDKLDRTEHQPKCARSYGKKRFDPSPSPSAYACGDLGYSLSRFAIYNILETLSTFDGQMLMQTSSKEDKLVGDLLSTSGIFPSEEDFECHKLKNLSDLSISVSNRKNTFFPSNLSLSKSTKLPPVNTFDREYDHIDRAQELWPKKIWPTCWSATVRTDSNQLEMLTNAQRALALLDSNELVLVAVMRNEMLILEHFLSHYRNLGVRCFIVVDNCSDDGTREYLIKQSDVILYSADTQYKYSHYGVAWQQAILGNLCIGKWVIAADADEFLVYENCEEKSIQELIINFETEKRNGALVYMIDMYPYGDLEEAIFESEDPFSSAPYFDIEPLIELKFGKGMYGNSKNFVNGFRHRIAPSRINAYVSQKYAVFKYYPWLRFSEGLHYAINLDLTEQPLFFAHFKYHSGFKDKIRTEIKRRQHFNGAEEYKKYALTLKESQGGFGAEIFSKLYETSHSFMEIVKKINK